MASKGHRIFILTPLLSGKSYITVPCNPALIWDHQRMSLQSIAVIIQTSPCFFQGSEKLRKPVSLPLKSMQTLLRAVTYHALGRKKKYQLT